MKYKYRVQILLHIFALFFSRSYTTETSQSSSGNTSIDNKPDSQPVFIFERDIVEQKYLKYLLTIPISSKNQICDLPKEKKISLCQQIFQAHHYKNIGIHVNLSAFFVETAKCEKHSFYLKTRIFFTEEEMIHDMFPCYGRHDPIRTNYKKDNFYRKFFVSSAPFDNSVIVYIHKYNAESDWYSIYNYIDNISLENLPDTLISSEELLYEFLSTKKIISTFNQFETEYVYVTERMYYNQYNDFICDLPKEEKIALCEMIIGRSPYRTNFWLTINRALFYIFRLDCHEKLLKIHHFKNYQKKYIVQRMYPCYTQLRIENANPILSKYNKIFYVSSGTRSKSVNVYIRSETSFGEQFSLFELYENIVISDLTPKFIVKLDESESSTHNYINTFFKYEALRTTSYTIIQKFREKSILLEMQKNMQRETAQLSKKKKTQIHKSFNNLIKSIENVLNDVCESENNWELQKQADQPLLEEDQLVSKIENLYNQFEYLKETRTDLNIELEEQLMNDLYYNTPQSNFSSDIKSKEKVEILEDTSTLDDSMKLIENITTDILTETKSNIPTKFKKLKSLKLKLDESQARIQTE